MGGKVAGLLGSLWASLGVSVGLAWCLCGPRLGSLWASLGVSVGLWGLCGPDLGSLWASLGVSVGLKLTSLAPKP